MLLVVYHIKKVLQVGRERFLRMCVVAVEVQKGAPPEIPFLWRGVEQNALLARVVKLAVVLAEREVHMNVAVIVGKLALFCVAEHARNNGKQQDEEIPMHVCERYKLVP